MNYSKIRLVIMITILLGLASCEFSCKDGKLTGFTSEDTTDYTCPAMGGATGDKLKGCIATCPTELSSKRNECLCTCACGTVCDPSD